MLLGNPHFPWDGPERFYQAQLTIPGEINVSGGSLFGVPLVLIGHTSKLAWSHTVSTAFRFTPFEVNLVPGDPTTYLVDGQPREMEADEVTVQARDGNGDLEERSRTLYSTEYGPMFNAIFGLPLFPWTSTSGYSMGDANASNFRYLNHFFETDLAQSTREYDEVLKRNQGIPWVNSIAADRAGRAYYADISVVPHVTDEKATQCNTALGRATYEALRLPVLNGSLSECDWGEDDDAAEPGIFGPSNLPSLFRDDYVTNSNDSYWLSNPEEPLEGFAPIIGDERTERTLRTRLGLRIVLDRLDGSDEYDGRRFNLGRLQDAVFNNRQYAGELWRDELAEFCREKPVMVGSEGPVDVREACPILEDWDLRDDLDSQGAILFRRFAGRALEVGRRAALRRALLRADPVNTPARAEHRQPGRGAGVRGLGGRAARPGHPAGRAAARVAVRGARRRRDPHPRRPGNRRRVQRDQRAVRAGRGLPQRAPRLELRAGRGADQGLPAGADDPHLLTVRPTASRRGSTTRRACSPRRSG